MTSGRSYTWLKWVAAAVLFVEAYVGVALPYLLRITPRAQWFLSLLNAFAGGVFFTFGARPLSHCPWKSGITRAGRSRPLWLWLAQCVALLSIGQLS